MVAAKTDRTHEGLAKQFAAHSIDRRYRAITGGIPRPAEGTVDAPLAQSAEPQEGGDRAGRQTP
jgi:23S rRNA pseudouridine1911/1915/1917 synthase